MSPQVFWGIGISWWQYEIFWDFKKAFLYSYVIVFVKDINMILDIFGV